MGTFYDVILRYKILLRANQRGNNNITIMKESTSLRSNGNCDRRIRISKLWTVTKHNGPLGISSKNNNIVLSLYFFHVCKNSINLCKLQNHKFYKMLLHYKH